MPSSSGRHEHRARTLLRGLQSSGLCVIYCDDGLVMRLIENLPPSWPGDEVVLAGGLSAVFDPFTAERVCAAKRDVLASGQSQRIEAPRRPDGEDLQWFEVCIERDAAPGEAPQGLFLTVTDITALKRRETALRDLLFEVSHRSRNMLAILQSILGQTAGKARSVAEFEQKFRGRIASIARSQDLITFANWQGVRFGRLAETQIASLAGGSGVAPSIEGSDPLMSPNVTLYLGLALHELAANSLAYGVLGNGKGNLRLLAERGANGCRIEWIETPRLPLAPPRDGEWGFGRTVLQNVVPRALRAEAVYSVDAAGVFYALDLLDLDGEASRPWRGNQTVMP